MKKITICLFSLFAIFGLASCVVQSSTTIEFEKLPEAVYVASERSNEDVEDLLEKITIKISGVEESINLTDSRLTVSGFNSTTLKTAGNYTLIVQYGSASVSFSYTVVAPIAPVKVSSANELTTAIAKGGVIELTDDIDLGTDKLDVNTDLVIYGNNFTVSSAGQRTFQMNSANEIKVIMYDLNIVNTGDTKPIEGGTDYARALSIGSKCSVDLVLEGCELTASRYCLNVNSRIHSVPSNITIKNSILKGHCAINVWSNACTFNIENSELISTWESKSETFGAIVLNGGARDFQNLGLQPGQTGQNNVINIKESTVKCENREAYGFAVVIQDACANNTINFDSVTIEYDVDKVYLPDKYVPVANRFYIDGVRQ